MMLADRLRIACAAGLVSVLAGGCASNMRSQDVPATPVPFATGLPRGGPVEARAACSNYRQVMGDTVYPRDAVQRGINEGKVIVRFTVDGSTLNVTSVIASDPAFVGPATAAVKKLTCQVERVAEFELPLTYRLH